MIEILLIILSIAWCYAIRYCAFYEDFEREKKEKKELKKLIEEQNKKKKEVEKNNIILNDETCITIGKKYADEFMFQYKEYLIS